MNQYIRRPNLFIVGAPKCGTTSLATWLSEHPQVFMSSPKEPNYFQTDAIDTAPEKRHCKDRKDYERLFTFAKPEHAVIGEASTRYLYSSTAVDNILDYNSEARIIVMVRNPVEMVRSLHGFQAAQGPEDVEELEAAWRLQADREKGNFIPRRCRQPQFLQYGAVCRLGKQVKRLYEVVPGKQRLVVVLDDLKKNPRSEWKRILRFLQIDDDGRTQFPTYNKARRTRSNGIRTALRTAADVKYAMRLPPFRLGIVRGLRVANSQEGQNAPISADLRAELRDYFRDDIVLLGKLLDRDFSGWLESEILA